MRGSERNLLLGVRNAIRAQAKTSRITNLRTNHVEVEHDEIAPATVAHQFVAVMPGGWGPGPRHKPSGGVWDLIFQVDVTVVKRIGEIPRDRINEAYLENLSCLDDLIEMVMEEIDFQYDVMNAINVLIAAEFGAAFPNDQGFMHPLVFAGVEKKPRVVDGGMFNAPARNPKNTIVGLGRTMYFNQARRIVVRRS